MGKVILEEQTGASTPASNKVAIYPKAGGGIYKKADDGVESLLATNQYIDTRLFGTVKAGSETLVSGTTSVTISYGSNFNDANYRIIATLQNTIDANPVVYDAIITGVTTSGFTATFASAMDSSNYKLNYYSTTASGVADQGGIDHGTLDGLTDDDHSQYHNDARGDARYYTETELDAGQLDNRYHTESEITTISGDLVTQIDALTHDGFADFVAGEHFTFASVSGTIDHNTIINNHNLTTDIDHDTLTNFASDEHFTFASVSGTIDHDTITNFTSAEHFTEASIDHGNIAGLSDNDHTQYVTGVSGSTPLRAGGQTIGFDSTVIDHDALTNFASDEHYTFASVSGTIDHDTILNFVADEHFTEASIDHGSIAGLSDDDHPQYINNSEMTTISGDLVAQLHTRSHTITSTADHTAGNWKVTYTNGSGEVIEVALGVSGTVLTSQGNGIAPIFV